MAMIMSSWALASNTLGSIGRLPKRAPTELLAVATQSRCQIWHPVEVQPALPCFDEADQFSGHTDQLA